ncbi:MAG: hypothetical protein AAF927_24520 [Bacteroidota bacterium]
MSVAPLPSHHPYYSRPASFPNVRDRLNRLTHRHLFLRSLVPAISFLDYGFLIPENASLSFLGDLSEISIVIKTAEVEDWHTAITASSFVNTHQIEKRNDQVTFKLIFQDASQLNLRLYTAFCYRGKAYQNIDLVLEKVLIHRDGIKIANICHSVEFHWLRSHELNRKFSTDFRPLLLAQKPEKQVEAARYICHKYRLESHRLFHLLTHTPTYRKSIERRMGFSGKRQKMAILGLASLFQLFMLSPSS